MPRQTNIRSLRLSDEMAELIDQQIGNTFTAKFTNLVIRCVWELPAKEAELERIQKQIQEERSRLNRIIQYRNELEQNARRMNQNLLTSLNQIDNGLQLLKRLLDKP